MKARVIVALIVSIAWCQASQAAFVLTAAGTSRGLSLSTFASGFTPIDIGGAFAGPLGIAFPSNGGVLVSDVSGNVRRFATNADNQSANTAVIGQNYGKMPKKASK